MATQSNKLLLHIKSIHKGIKYSCNQCDFRATFESNLQRHIKTKHEELKSQWQCDQCEYKTSDSSNLNRHKKSMHKIAK